VIECSACSNGRCTQCAGDPCECTHRQSVPKASGYSSYCANARHNDCQGDFFTSRSCKCQCHQPIRYTCTPCQTANHQACVAQGALGVCQCCGIGHLAAKRQAVKAARRMRSIEMAEAMNKTRWACEGRWPTAVEARDFVFSLPQELQIEWFERSMESMAHGDQCIEQNHDRRLQDLATDIRVLVDKLKGHHLVPKKRA
jgi:hypothetical protein